MFYKLALTSIFLFFISTSFSQTDTGEQTHSKLIKVSNKIYMLQGKGGNIGLSVGHDGVFMIDAQFADNIEQTKKDIKKVNDKPVKLLVNTHFHGDHTGGNAAMAQTGSIILSQVNVRKRLLGTIKDGAKKIPQETLPVVTFSKDLSFHFNGEEIYVFHVKNAHTDGDAMVYFPDSNVLHTGDVFFNGKYPFIDLENGGDLLGCVEAIEKALGSINESTKIIPGHGNLGTYKDLQKAAELLSGIYRKVNTLYLKKKTEDEVAIMTDLTREYDTQGYGDGFISTEAFLRMVYKSVAQERKAIEDNAEKNKAAREKVKKMMNQKE